MKKYMLMAVAALVALASCNNESPKMDEQPAATDNATGGVKIAYVEVDSLMTQYEFCKEFTLILQKKSNNARNTLNQKGQAQVGGQAVLGRQSPRATPWLTERHGYDPTSV